MLSDLPGSDKIRLGNCRPVFPAPALHRPVQILTLLILFAPEDFLFREAVCIQFGYLLPSL